MISGESFVSQHCRSQLISLKRSFHLLPTLELNSLFTYFSCEQVHSPMQLRAYTFLYILTITLTILPYHPSIRVTLIITTGHLPLDKICLCMSWLLANHYVQSNGCKTPNVNHVKGSNLTLSLTQN